ncbi:ABC transporter ATP-binding protein [Alteriqipengyuania sp. 357]
MKDKTEIQQESATPTIKGALRRVITAARPPRAMIIAGVIISLLPIAATLAMPILVQQLIAAMGEPGGDVASVLGHPLTLGIVILLAAGALIDGFAQYTLALAGLKMGLNLRLKMFGDIIRRPIKSFENDESGGLVSRLTTDTQVISGLLTKQVSGLVSGVLLLLGSLAILFYLDAELTLMIFGIILSAFVLMAPMIFAMNRITLAVNDSTAAFSGYATRIFGNIALVKAYTAEAAETDRMADRLDAVFRERKRASMVEAALGPANGLTLTIAMLAILTYGGFRVSAGTLEIGTLTAFILYLFNIVAPLIQLSAFSVQFQASKGAASRIAPLLEGARSVDPMVAAPRGPATASRSAMRPIPQGKASLVLDQVKFGYGAVGEEPVIAIDRLEFAPGTQTVLTGESGCGKSTLFGLLERFYEPWEGQISFGNEPIAEFDVAQWRRKIGYVPQSASLLRGTIRENVIYGSEGEANDDAVLAALEAASCMSFVDAMPDGLDTNVGEAGTLVSGGQKQRLAIARLFYRDPKILLLDEATANLDNENQAAVLAVIERLMDDRITIMSTHRVEAIGRRANIISLSRTGTKATVGRAPAMEEVGV